MKDAKNQVDAICAERNLGNDLVLLLHRGN
jgi:hypothetical protein